MTTLRAATSITTDTMTFSTTAAAALMTFMMMSRSCNSPVSNLALRHTRVPQRPALMTATMTLFTMAAMYDISYSFWHEDGCKSQPSRGAYDVHAGPSCPCLGGADDVGSNMVEPLVKRKDDHDDD